jgi:SAM-dependent methyltransferase
MTKPLHEHSKPSSWITRFAPLVPQGARVLDVAAGRGRHARYFAGRGAQVLALDADGDALAALAGHDGIVTRVVDFEAHSWPLPEARFDAIVVTNYLHRPHFAHLRAALASDGVLLYETFAMGNEAFGRPSNPDHLLCAGELLSLAALPPDPLTIVAFEQGLVTEGGRRAVVQRLAAIGPARAWPPPLPA